MCVSTMIKLTIICTGKHIKSWMYQL